MAFIDEVEIRVEAGAGGNGCRSFRREKYIPFGGPNGGNGGRGGNVYLVPTQNKSSLLDFKFEPVFRAKRGEHGMGSDMDGAAGDDLYIQVPVGTIVYDKENNETIVDLVDEEKPFLIAEGGRGGKGNLHFKSSTNRAPNRTTPGLPGEALAVRLELRLLADLGLVGLPNAGKSSFLRVISRAHPKVADYPFTTLDPVLGVVRHKGTNLVIADLPGLIEGAAEGAGLGHRFLKHVSRNRLLLHLVDFSSEPEEIAKQVEVIRNELKAYGDSLVHLPEILVFTKADLVEESQRKTKLEALSALGLNGFLISSHTSFGVEPLLNELTVRAQSWIKVPEKTEEEDSEGDLRRYI